MSNYLINILYDEHIPGTPLIKCKWRIIELICARPNLTYFLFI